jgi:predicted component of type VI protein secretion system
MDHTHTSDTGVGPSTEDPMHQHPADALADLDPADAPAPAERYAHELATELEEAGAAPADPVQLQADLGDEEGTGIASETG